MFYKRFWGTVYPPGIIKMEVKTMKDIFEKNTIKSAVEEIQKLVTDNGYYIILFPFYFPELGIGQKHSVVGKPRCQTRIANLLKSNGIEGKKLAPCFYVFFSNDITEEEKKNAELEARRCAYWYDIIGD